MSETGIVREQIRHTMARYHHLGDQGLQQERVFCFTPDGILATPLWTAQGREQIRELLMQRKPTDGRSPRLVRHHLTTCHLDVLDNGAATGRSYFAVYTDAGPDHVGVYLDQFALHEGQWLIASRTVTLDWKAEHSYVRQSVWWQQSS